MGIERPEVVGAARTTSRTVAEKAGVSQTTVSRVMNGNPDVSEEKRQRVLEWARLLNYRPDKNAAGLRRQCSNTLALLFFEDPTPDDSLINPFFLSMLGPITRACARHGYDLLISFQNLAGNWYADFEDSRKADGIILLGYGDYLKYRPQLEQLVQQGTHFVRYGAVLEGQPGLSIGCDNFKGGYDAARHLISLGRRNIAFLGHASGNYPEFLERYRGYAKALRESGFVPSQALQVDAVSSESSGAEAAHELLTRPMEFDAIFAASDMIAIGAMQALKDADIEVPAKVSVVGFDDIPAAHLANPALTTVSQDTKRAGEVLVETLLHLVRGEPAEGTVLPPQLIVRRSSAAVKAP